MSNRVGEYVGDGIVGGVDKAVLTEEANYENRHCLSSWPREQRSDKTPIGRCRSRGGANDKIRLDLQVTPWTLPRPVDNRSA